MSEKPFDPKKWEDDAAVRAFFHRKEGLTPEGDVAVPDRTDTIQQIRPKSDLKNLERPSDTEVEMLRAQLHTETANTEAQVTLSDDGDVLPLDNPAQ